MVLAIFFLGQNLMANDQKLKDPPEEDHIKLLKTEIWILPSGDIEYYETIEAIGKIEDIKQQKYSALPIYYRLLESNTHVGFKKKYTTKAIYFFRNFRKNIRKNMVNKGYRQFDVLLYDAKGGHAWEQTIDSIHCTVHLPKGGKLLLQEKFRMAHPELSKDIVRTKIDNETIVFSSKQKIKPNDVFLIGVYFNKGIVDASFEEIKEKDSEGLEYIKLFKSEIWIKPSGTINVKEQIELQACGDEIKRGIIRSFPTIYTNKSGGNKSVSFDVHSVKKQKRGLNRKYDKMKNEKYEVRNSSNGKNIYIGDPDILLEENYYNYEINYSTHGQLGYFETFDELYWNVNGLDWTFIIDSIACIVHLPEGASILKHAGYSGYEGQKNKDFTTKILNDNTIGFYSTKGYNSNEGLTIAVSWPKGFVDRPSAFIVFFKEYNVYIFIIFATICIFTYYYFVWKKVGKDPPKGAVYPLFSPPDNLSPSLIGFTYNFGFSKHLLSCEIVNLAAKGAITIKETKYLEEYFTLYKNEVKGLNRFEKNICNALFSDGNELNTHHKQYKKFRAANKVIEKECNAFNRNEAFFSNNFAFSILGIFITLALIIIGWYICFQDIMIIFLMIPFIIISIIVGGIGHELLKKYPIKINKFPITQYSIFVLVSLVFCGVVINSEGYNLFTLFILFIMTLNLLFVYLLKAPTYRGQKLIAKIEGFLMYLDIAEEERLRHLHPPDVTQEVFEKYLPYAMVLGVENEWGRKFDQYIKNANIEMNSNSISWYNGSSFTSLSASSFSSKMSSSFGSSISSSSSPPGSSSGSSGGGSSGGGGGGGGGSGW